MPNLEGIGNSNEVNNEQAAEWDMTDAPEMPTDDIPPEPTDDVPAMNAEFDQSSDVETDQPADGETEKNHEAELDPRVESLAALLAHDYAEKNYRRLEDGTLEPAWRGKHKEPGYKNKSPEQLMDEFQMSEEEARAAVVDIANQPYSEFSEDWKESNRTAAEFLMKLADERGADTIAKLDLTDDSVRAEYGDLIHNEWLRNNSWVMDEVSGDPVLSKPFSELPPAEQQKDIDQLALLIQWIKEQGE